jgi:uncharacterized protein (TIGR03437 family)
MVSWEKCVLFLFFSGIAAAQITRMDLQQTRYRIRIGEPAAIAASSDTLEFLRNAKSRRVDTVGASEASGLVVAQNRSGEVVLAASARAKAGEYTAQITATSASGEVRQTALTVNVSPRITVPSNSTRNPVVLLNGWETGFTNSCPVSSSSSDTFGNLAQYLVSDGVPVVYLFDNCLEDPNSSIEQLGVDLGTFLQTIQYDNGTQVPQIDLVAFSMGGLIARAYLAGLQTSEALIPPTPALVGKLVLIATPNFGSFVAGNYATEIPAGSQSYELEPGSAFLWNAANWNQRSDDLRGVSAIAVIGNAGNYLPNISSGTELTNASDGIVSLTSASLGFIAQQTSTTRVVPYCHVDPSAFTNANFGAYLCNAAGIANVTSTTHYTGEIVRSFLAGTSDWQSIGTTPATDPYLSKYSGMYFALASQSGPLASDVTQATWGTLQLTQGGDTGVIYYQDFVSGTGALQITSTSLGTFNCGTYTQSLGYFSALRCKIDAAIFSIGPLLSAIPRIVTAGGNITIAGADFSSQCIGCKVTATPAGSSTATVLQINSWTNTSISAVLPSSLTGFLTITVYAVTGSDSMAIMAATASPSTIATSPASLQFSYTVGGTTPDAQSVQLTNSGSGTLSWTATASQSWLSVTPSSGTAPSTLSISVSPASLSAGTYTGNVQVTASGASNTPLTIGVTLTVSQAAGPPPTITGVLNAASYQAIVAPATWVSIFGTNLAATTYTWQSSDIVDGQLPTSLQGVSVTIDGIPAFVEYVSPSQINVLAPDDTTTGPVQVQVTVSGQTSSAFTATESQFSPGFFTIDSAGHVAALHADYSPINTSRPAQPGETILLYATGLGPTTPVSPTSQVVSTPAGLANSAQVTIGGTAATVSFAGLVEPGTYQLNVIVPNVSSGDAALLATVNGVSTQSGVLVTVGQ